MLVSNRLLGMAAGAACLLAPATSLGSSRVHWDYSDRFGPALWGNLSSRFAACGSGTQQSPIDLAAAVETTLNPVEINWRAAQWEAGNTGTTLLIQSTEAGHAIIDGDRYALVQFHIHSPSEHAINGQHFPMELQFVHVAEDDRIAVVSVMLKGGGRNPAFEAVMAAAPTQKDDRQPLSGFDPSTLLTDPTDILRYQGSLTQPPCTENVIWTVLTDPLVVSDAAIDAFRLMFGNNARPLQPLNRRYVLTD